MKYEVFVPKAPKTTKNVVSEIVVTTHDKVDQFKQEKRYRVNKANCFEFEVDDDYHWVNSSNKSNLLFEVKVEFIDSKGRKKEVQLVPAKVTNAS